MGTRSTTKFYEDGEHICTMFRMFDGYISGHGHELGSFLASKDIINGIRSGDTAERCANGYGDLVAQVIHHFKDETLLGGYYLVPESVTEGYTYRVDFARATGVVVTVTRDDRDIFSGRPAQLADFKEPEE